MDITDLIEQEFESVESDRPVSSVLSAFSEPGTKAIVVTDDGAYAGVVTRRELVSSHQPPGQKVGTVRVSAPTVTGKTGVRETARLMIQSGVYTLPVLEGTDEVVGVVTATDLLSAVGSRFDVFDVGEVYSPDLVTVRPETTFGQVLARFRDHRITHLPVVDDDDVVGIVSLADVLALAVRETHRVQAGSTAGAERSPMGVFQGQSGDRAVERDRMRELPVRDVMTGIVETIGPDEGLDVAVERMTDRTVSSLVVDDDGPIGIVTVTDALEALTREPDEQLRVQVFNTDLLDDLDRETVASMIEATTRKHAALGVLEAKVHLQRHKEQRHGVPLLLARIRLYTDDGTFVVSGEGFGAAQAFGNAVDRLGRKLIDDKTTRHPSRRRGLEDWIDRFGR